MKLHRRRLTFQLTPLLDLLLIVIFAQYMEMRETASQVESEAQRRANQRVAAAEAERRAMADELAAARREFAEELMQTQADREQFEQELRNRLSELARDLERALAHRKEVAELLATLFEIPEETIEAVLAQQDRSPEETEQLRKLYRKLADERTNEAIKHLLTHSAMRKRVDVWEVWVDRTGLAHLDTGRNQYTFRFRGTTEEEARRLAGAANKRELLERFREEAAERFANEFVRHYQTMPQPKDIVVTLYSEKPGVPFRWRDPAEEGLARALQRLGGRGVQFVPANMGLEVQNETATETAS